MILQGFKLIYSGTYVVNENYIPVEFQKFHLKDLQEPKTSYFKSHYEILLTLTLTMDKIKSHQRGLREFFSN